MPYNAIVILIIPCILLVQLVGLYVLLRLFGIKNNTFSITLQISLFVFVSSMVCTFFERLIPPLEFVINIAAYVIAAYMYVYVLKERAHVPTKRAVQIFGSHLLVSIIILIGMVLLVGNMIQA